MNKIILTENSMRSVYDKVYALQVGDVFKVEGNYETIMRRLLEDYKPTNINFEVTDITAGTSLYTMYGCDHLVVTCNSLI